jgi:hypothetical protein
VLEILFFKAESFSCSVGVLFSAIHFSKPWIWICIQPKMRNTGDNLPGNLDVLPVGDALGEKHVLLHSLHLALQQLHLQIMGNCLL